MSDLSGEASSDWTVTFPLYVAAYIGDLDAIRGLIASGHDVNGKNPYGETALMNAARKARSEVCKTLLDAGADVNAQSDIGTALHLAASHGHKETCELLLGAGARTNARDDRGDTPLHDAVDNGCDDICALLIAAGSDIEAKNDAGMTPLHYATVENSESCRILIAAGADVNATDFKRRAPLHCAADLGTTQACEQLLSATARIDALNQHGMSAQELAEGNGHHETAKILSAYALAKMERAELDISAIEPRNPESSDTQGARRVVGDDQAQTEPAKRRARSI